MKQPLRQPHRDNGQILPLIIIYVMIALSLVIVVADVTSVHVQRNRLYALADSAALNAANALDSPYFYGQEGLLAGGEQLIPLSNRSVVTSVREYLPNASATANLSPVSIEDPTGSPDPGTAQVTLAARARLPILGVVVQTWWDGVPLLVTVEAQARDPG